MNSNQTPDFKPKDIVLNISQVVKDGIKQSVLASKGNDWESVVGVLDNNEHLIGKEMSVNSHLNAVMFSESFNALPSVWALLLITISTLSLTLALGTLIDIIAKIIIAKNAMAKPRATSVIA